MHRFGPKHPLFFPAALALGALVAVSGTRPPRLSAVAARAAARARAHHEEDTHRRGAAELWWRQRAYPAGRIPRGAYPAALARFQTMKPAHPGRGKLTWQLIGPAPLDTASGVEPPNPNWSPAAGRVAAIAVDPSDAKTLYVGPGSGGVWKSTDGGASWASIFDAQPSSAVSAITLDPAHPQTVWVGSGSGDPFAGYYGAGLFKSTDGGATWARLGADVFDGVSLSRVILDPQEGRVYVAATFGGAGNGDACTNTDVDAPGQGVWRSDDDGATWSSLLPGSIIDLELDTSVTPRRLAVYDYYSGAHRSDDGGVTWTDPTGLPEMEDRIELAIAPSMPNVVYAGVGAGGVSSLFVSTDFGESFTAIPGVPDYCEGQCYYDDVVTVAPDDPGTVWLGGATCSVWKGTGLLGPAPSFAAVSLPNLDCGQDDEHWADAYVHSDAHAIVVDAHDPKAVYVGSDGGLSRTPDGGVTWTRLNDGISTIELYSVCADPADPNVFFGGAQDNGPFMRTKDTLTWTGISTGDGSGCAIDPAQPSRVMVGIQYATTFLSTDRFQNDFQYVFDTQMPWCDGLAGCGDRVSFIPPMAAHPTAPHTFYIGTYRLWRSQSGGDDGSWKAISDDLTAGLMAAPCVPPGSGQEDDYLSAIGPAPGDPGTIYVGSASGALSGTFDDGATWARLGQAALPTRYLTGIAVDAVDAKQLAVAFSGFDASTPATPGHVFRSSDGGVTWKAGDIGMDAPVDALLGHPTLPGVVYAGLEMGVIVSIDGGATWAPLGAGLPNASVWSLSFSPGTSSLVAGTHGRSAWKITFAPALDVSPVALTVTVEEGAQAPARTLSVLNAERYGSTLTASLAASEAWIGVPAASGVAGGQNAAEVAVAVDASGKKAGTYDGAVTVDAGSAGNVTVPVHLVVTKPAPPPPPVKAVATLVAAGGGCALDGRGGTAGSALAALALAALVGRRRRAR